MKHLKVGHYTDKHQGTGISVFLFDTPAKGAYTLCGSAPATRELNLLDVEATIPAVDGLMLAGGSAFGLCAVEGAMRWLKEKNRGYVMPDGVVPLMPAAGLYDLAVKTPFTPTAEHAYQACEAAVYDNDQEGAVGAGTGASIGKFIQNAKPMSGGLGRAELTLSNGVKVLAYVVVNSLGDVIDEKNNIIAGARLANSQFANCAEYLLQGNDDWLQPPALNTTLAAVFTNASFSKAELKRISKMAIAGMARAISPAFTSFDGDIVFCFSLGDLKVSENIIGMMAAEAVRQAIINAVKQSITL